MSEADRPQAEQQETILSDPAPPGRRLPDWAAASLIGLIVATGFSALIAQLKPAEGARPAALKGAQLVSIAEAARTKSSLQQKGMAFEEGDEGLRLVPFHAEATALTSSQGEGAVARQPVKPADILASADVAAAGGAAVGPSMAPATTLPPSSLPPPSAPPSSAPRPAVPLKSRAMIAIVIDDLGLKQNASLRAAELAGPLTLAFLPYGENLQSLADTARANGHEVIVHLPMQGAATNDPGPKALINGLSPEELAARIAWSLSRFTGYTGINNHMGSKFTENAAGMAQVYDALAARNLFYLDSRTTAKSAARTLAINLKIPYAERDVFLDNTQDASYVAVQLAETEMLARRHGSAIAIGHPHQVTLETLARWIPTLAAKGIDLVPVSRVIAARASPTWRLAAYGNRKDG
jgi:uncharacterized protein